MKAVIHNRLALRSYTRDQLLVSSLFTYFSTLTTPPRSCSRPTHQLLRLGKNETLSTVSKINQFEAKGVRSVHMETVPATDSTRGQVRGSAYYSALTKNWPNIQILTVDHGTRKGIFATRDLPEDELLFEEFPFAAITTDLHPLPPSRQARPRPFRAIGSPSLPSNAPLYKFPVPLLATPSHCAHCFAPLNLASYTAHPLSPTQLALARKENPDVADVYLQPFDRAKTALSLNSIPIGEYPFLRTQPIAIPIRLHQKGHYTDELIPISVVFCSSTCHEVALDQYFRVEADITGKVILMQMEGKERYEHLEKLAKECDDTPYISFGLRHLLFRLLSMIIQEEFRILGKTIDIGDSDKPPPLSTPPYPIHPTPLITLHQRLLHLPAKSSTSITVERDKFREYFLAIFDEYYQISLSSTASLPNDSIQENCSLRYWLSEQGFDRLLAIAGRNTVEAALQLYRIIYPVRKQKKSDGSTAPPKPYFEVETDEEGDVKNSIKLFNLFSLTSYLSKSIDFNAVTVFPQLYAPVRWVTSRPIKKGEELSSMDFGELLNEKRKEHEKLMEEAEKERQKWKRSRFKRKS